MSRYTIYSSNDERPEIFDEEERVEAATPQEALLKYAGPGSVNRYTEIPRTIHHANHATYFQHKADKSRVRINCQDGRA